MATLRTSTPLTTMLDLVRRLSPVPPFDLFDLQDCNDSGAREHVVDPSNNAGDDDVCVLRQEVA